jgi:hypothetical protein
MTCQMVALASNFCADEFQKDDANSCIRTSVFYVVHAQEQISTCTRVLVEKLTVVQAVSELTRVIGRCPVRFKAGTPTIVIELFRGLYQYLQANVRQNST